MGAAKKEPIDLGTPRGESSGGYRCGFYPKCDFWSDLKVEVEAHMRSPLHLTKQKEEFGSPESSGAEILLNPILQIDRFGQGLKDGSLYYGLLLANKKGERLPGVFFNNRLIYGEEQTEQAGFRFDSDILLVGETWSRAKLYEHISAPKPAKGTEELLRQIIARNKLHVFHEDERAHLVVAAYTMLTYLFSAFKQCPRIVFIGFPGSGKSTQTDLMSMLSCNAVQSSDISKAAIFRIVEATAGLIAVDNFDNLGEEEKADFTQIFDTSFESGRHVFRVEDAGRRKAPRAFRTFCPMAVNCVDSSWMKSSSVSRSVIVRMVINSEANLKPIKVFFHAEAEDLKHQLRVWALNNVQCLQELADSIDVFSNREADITKPLLAILKDAGGSYFEEGKAFLEKNFSEQRGDEFSDSSNVLIAIHEVAISKEPATDGLIELFIKEVAGKSLELKGIEEHDQEGHENKSYPGRLLKECQMVGAFIRNTPFRRKTTPGNRAKYHYVPATLFSFLKKRGVELSSKAESYLQTNLTEPNTPNQPNLTSPTSPNLTTTTNLTKPSDVKENEHVRYVRYVRSGGATP